MDNKRKLANKVIVVDVSETSKFDGLMNDFDDKSDKEELLELYKTYEYTDRFVLLTDNANYGSLWNYYKTGVMSEEELVEVLLR